MWRRKSVLNCVTNTSSVIVQVTRRVMVNTGKFRSRLFSHVDCHCFIHSGEPAGLRPQIRPFGRKNAHSPVAGVLLVCSGMVVSGILAGQTAPLQTGAASSQAVDSAG